MPHSNQIQMFGKSSGDTPDFFYSTKQIDFPTNNVPVWFTVFIIFAADDDLIDN